MMERLDEIVEEVVRRLKRYMAEKRVLLLLRDDSDFSRVKDLVQLLEAADYTIVVCSFLLKDVKVLEDPAFRNRAFIRAAIFKEVRYDEFLRGFHGVLISDLHFEECRAYLDLRFMDTIGKIVFETVKENKPVYAISSEMTGVKNPYLKERTNSMKEELSKMKLHLFTEDWHPEGASKTSAEEKQKTEKGKNPGGLREQGEEKVCTHRFITLSDVNTLKASEAMWISPEAKLTMEASDYARRNGIRIRRK
ncbi:hypothetical protein J3A84_03145 [Proteiniclasticum sp. SCR006]|uniref:Uncharacterized protein n=1 Tax=Proteiniclasticum aestuarii TaxID=2817862 RepID=A0A939H4J8_9CLOT|nr:hypothetical protein [Proteiniclasticum aestuarii]MBO1264039.1 hypothetical protein [Proteiniclasticum aestuarii]